MATVPGVRPLGYVGLKESNPPQIVFRPRDPDLVDFRDFRNYDIGDLWQNVITTQWFIMISKKTVVVLGQPVTQGKWVAITGMGVPVGGIQTLNGVAPDAFGAFTLNAGTNITIVPGVNSLTINAVVPPPVTFPWIEVFVNTPMAVNTGYFISGGALVMTLPVLAAQGDIIEISGKSGTWSIAQNPGQFINLFGQPTTPGVGGSITSFDAHDTLRLVCATPNVEWNALSSGGNLTVV